METVANLGGVPQPEAGPGFGYLSHHPIMIDARPDRAGGARGGGFEQYRFGHADTANLPRIVGKDFKVRAELMPIIECLSRHSATEFCNVSEMYASVRAGAQSVVTCEMVPAIAEAAREIIALNGFAERVRVVAKKSYDLDPDVDMGGLADVFVSEIVDNMLLREDVLPVTEHAVKVLLKPGAKIIPARGLVRVALAYDAKFDDARMGTINGFDLSPFNRLAPNFHRARDGGRHLTLLSMATTLFEFDFQSGGPFPATTVAKTLMSTGGEANGIAQWIALQMDEEGWYENDPKPGASSAWAVMFWPFTAPRDCPAGTTIEVGGSHDRRTLQIWA